MYVHTQTYSSYTCAYLEKLRVAISATPAHQHINKQQDRRNVLQPVQHDIFEPIVFIALLLHLACENREQCKYASAA